MAVESEFVDIAHKVAAQLFPAPAYEVRRGAALLYRIMVDDQLAIQANPREPKRGSSAFQTDLCVFEQRSLADNEVIFIPRVVLEFKTSVTTHDVLTYSTKARKHKQIYPYLRYGMVASSHKEIPGRFFSHNEALDFFAAVEGMENEFEGFLKELLSNELEYSKSLEKIAFDKKEVRTRLYQSIPKLL
ncbi:hypothetical protein CO608_01890 [Lysobacteraceae bacterium NML08-0793]|nr:hypothetical protein CO608_01890 [Xanthomonadaceae bacterium NML08-0793]